MVEIERNWTHWQLVAQHLFLEEYEAPKQFFEKFSEPSILYYEIAKRVVASEVHVYPQAKHPTEISWTIEDLASKQVSALLDATAYTLMERAFAVDAKNNNNDELDKLVTNYQANQAGERR